MLWAVKETKAEPDEPVAPLRWKTNYQKYYKRGLRAGYKQGFKAGYAQGFQDGKEPKR